MKSDLLGESFSLSGRIIENENGVEVNLNNSVDDIDVYTVQRVGISAGSNISFHGIKVGDSLKDTDKILMHDLEPQYWGWQAKGCPCFLWHIQEMKMCYHPKN